jgi:hypothetical protein
MGCIGVLLGGHRVGCPEQVFHLREAGEGRVEQVDISVPVAIMFQNVGNIGLIRGSVCIRHRIVSTVAWHFGFGK